MDFSRVHTFMRFWSGFFVIWESFLLLHCDTALVNRYWDDFAAELTQSPAELKHWAETLLWEQIPAVRLTNMEIKCQQITLCLYTFGHMMWEFIKALVNFKTGMLIIAQNVVLQSHCVHFIFPLLPRPPLLPRLDFTALPLSHFFLSLWNRHPPPLWSDTSSLLYAST